MRNHSKNRVRMSRWSRCYGGAKLPAAVQGDLLFVALFGAVSIITIVETIRRLSEIIGPTRLFPSVCEIFATLAKFFRPVTLQSGFFCSAVRNLQQMEAG